MDYNFKQIESKWQRIWQESGIYEVKNPDYYVLSMLPYPSGRLHMGHLRNYCIGDVLARFKTLEGKKVLHPMGWDAFGLPAENAAIENGVHPKEWTLQNIKQMKKELQAIGFSFDWSREEITCLPEYYKHEQKMFLDFLKHDIAYRKESIVNWDPVDNTVLANEQVIDGKGWRSGAFVEKRSLSQWFLRISSFSKELLEDLKTLEKWPEKVKIMQENWIGKSEGAEINFDIETGGKIKVFTTRPDTLFGASFIAISYAHQVALEISNPEVEAFIKKCELGSTKAEDVDTAEKEGIFTGLYAINPVNNEFIPVWIANFVLMDYGTGAIFGCPSADARDFEFATKYSLPIKIVVSSLINSDLPSKVPFMEEGIIVNSEFLNGLPTQDAKRKIIEWLEEKKCGRGVINYRLRDWGVSRQRYWGCPIPVIHCKKCGIVAAPQDQLPISLPDDIKIEPGENPLKKHPTWRFVSCYKCGGEAERETDTFDTFFESSWYFLRYCSSRLAEKAFDNPMKVNDYIGGIEHAILHLLYSRFFVKALIKCGYNISFEEPFERLITQGMVCHKTFQDLQGRWLTPEEANAMSPNFYQIGPSIKMSKSKKNTVEPAVIISEYGADTARFFMMSDTPPERDFDWNTDGLSSSHKFLSKIWHFVLSLKDLPFEETKDPEILKALHRALAHFKKEIEAVALNKGIARIRELSNVMFSSDAKTARFLIEYVLIMLKPFAPHTVCELGEVLNAKFDKFPEVKQEFLLDDIISLSIQINGKLRGVIQIESDTKQEKIKENIMLNQNIARYFEGKKIVKEIYIPDKIFSFVLK